jgi:hypothetical protein
MKAYLHDLQRISNEQDVGRLLLLLKELIPDYNPGSRLLRAALSIQSGHAESAKSQIPVMQARVSVAAEPAPANRIN